MTEADLRPWDHWRKPANPNQAAVQSLAGPQVYEGFNDSRPQDVNKSAKDSFRELSAKAPTAPIHDKSALGAWFDQYIRTGMDERGHRTTGPAQGDKFSYGNHEGNFTVDFGRGAGAPGGALAWQAEGSDDETRRRYGNPISAIAARGSGAPVSTTMPVRGRTSTSSGSGGFLEQILSEIQAQQEQQPDFQALLQQALR